LDIRPNKNKGLSVAAALVL